MDVVDINSLSKSVLWATFLIALTLGAVMQKTGFCSMGAISDAFIMSSWDRFRQWFLAIGVAIVGFALMSYFGVIDPLKSFYTSNKFLWLSTLVGSTLFGFGMVLASGCGSKTLVRIGGGNLKSIIDKRDLPRLHLGELEARGGELLDQRFASHAGFLRGETRGVGIGRHDTLDASR